MSVVRAKTAILAVSAMVGPWGYGGEEIEVNRRWKGSGVGYRAGTLRYETQVLWMEGGIRRAMKEFCRPETDNEIARQRTLNRRTLE
jgi:hypothetical protein